MKREFLESPEIEAIAKEVLKKESIDIMPAKVSYLMVEPMISKNIFGRCIRCSSELAHYADTDYIIEISKLQWDLLSEKSKYLLVYHELLHIKVEYNEKKDSYAYRLARHNIEDFAEIIKRHGIDWLEFVNETNPDEDTEEEEDEKANPTLS